MEIAFIVNVLASRSKQGPGYQMHYLKNSLELIAKNRNYKNYINELEDKV